MGISTAFPSAEFVLALAVGLVGGLICVLWPESVRAFAARLRIPAHAGRRFRAMPVRDSEACRSAFRAMPVRRFDAG